MSRLPAGVMREARIDVEAIADNVRHLRRLTGSEVIAVVKADGYGHGAFRSAVAALQGGASRIGVADVTEALALRRAGIRAPILAWLHAPGASFSDAVAADIELGISGIDQLLQAAAAASAARPVSVHLKIETGLSRNGIAPEDYRVVFAEAARLERIGKVRVIGLFSHLANASEAEDRSALAAFKEGVVLAASLGLDPPLRHIAATNAAIALPESRLGCVRIGIGIYGLSPFADRSSADLGLRPAMTLRSAVAAVRRVPAGKGVSYGYDHRTDRDTTLALVPLGYADGVPRQASGSGPVSIGGRRFTVAGRIAMDQFVVDVGDAAVAVGDEVVLFGDPTLGFPAASEWADAAARSTTRSSRASDRACRGCRWRDERARGAARHATRSRRPVRWSSWGARSVRRSSEATWSHSPVRSGRGRRRSRAGSARASASAARCRAPLSCSPARTPRSSADRRSCTSTPTGSARRSSSDDLDLDVTGSVVVVEWGGGMADHLADRWWQIDLVRQTGGRGIDSACGDPSRAVAELDADAPRAVTISRRP